MFLDQLAIDVSTVGAVEILEERIVEDINDQRVVPADGRVVDTNVVVREPPDRVALLIHVVFGEDRAIQTQNQPSHVPLASGGAEPTQHLVQYSAMCRE